MVDWIFDCFKTYSLLCRPYMYCQQQSTIVDNDCILCCSIHMYCSLSVYNHRLYMGLLVLWCNHQIVTRGYVYVCHMCYHQVKRLYVTFVWTGCDYGVSRVQWYITAPSCWKHPLLENENFQSSRRPHVGTNDPPPTAHHTREYQW